MNKSKRIAIGGWLQNLLSVATRGWFGGSIRIVPACLSLAESQTNSQALTESANILTLSEALTASFAITELANTLTLSEAVTTAITLSEEVC